MKPRLRPGLFLCLSGLSLTVGPVRPANSRPADSGLITELKRFAIPLKTERAGSGFEDLAPLGKAIGDARIVGLGEASHGTAEFFRMKHRLLEYLVEKKGFTVFAIEANWPESEMADRYVKSGEGDPVSSLQNMYFWTWQTEEVRDMLDWMKSYNTRPGVKQKITFTSFDMQHSEVAEKEVRDYLDEVDRANGEKVSTLYEGLPPDGAPPAEEAAGREGLGKVRHHAAEVVQIFEQHRADYEKTSSPERYRRTLQCARVILQRCTMIASAAYDVRDGAMADNVRWLADESHPGEKIVLWAHNGHVSASRFGSVSKPMGYHLRKAYGGRYFVIGFASDHGSIRAVRMNKEGIVPGGTVSIPLPNAAAGSVEALFREAHVPRFALPLRSLPGVSRLKKYVSEPHTHRMPGAAYDPDRDQKMYVRAPLASMYDAIVFLAESTAAKPLILPK